MPVTSYGEDQMVGEIFLIMIYLPAQNLGCLYQAMVLEKSSQKGSPDQSTWEHYKLGLWLDSE